MGRFNNVMASKLSPTSPIGATKGPMKPVLDVNKKKKKPIPAFGGKNPKFAPTSPLTRGFGIK